MMSDGDPALPTSDPRSRDRVRPALHFTPPRGWMNDPCGLVRLGDRYHLFYQHNPGGTSWGDIHWGHAASRDLQNWEHLPIALAPDELGEIFTGSVVVDVDGTAGFGSGALVAAFTHDGRLGQVQSLAGSIDDGVSWEMYAGNPVLVPATESPDFRDPKLVRFVDRDDPGASWWVMALAVGGAIEFYRSANLREWEPTGAYRPDLPDGTTLEVPDLVQVPVAGGGVAWTLIYSVIPAPSDVSDIRRVRWVTGEFDGLSFHPAMSGGLLDAGPSFYAAMVWPETAWGPVCIGWMDESQQPMATGSDWCGRMSVPRALVLERDGEQVALRQRPILPRREPDWVSVGAGVTERFDLPETCAIVRVDGSPLSSAERIIVSVAGESDVATAVIGPNGVTLSVPGHVDTELRTTGRPVDHLLVVDVGSVELFAHDGRSVASATSGPIRPTVVSVENHASSPVRVAAAPCRTSPSAL